MNVISYSIFKGGTGKTTSVVSTAAALARKSKKVLVVDLDQQASATRYLGIDPDTGQTMTDVFMGKPAALARRQTAFGIDLLPASPSLAAVEQMLEMSDLGRVSGYLTALKPEYDFILVDTPPGKAKLTFNGLVAADVVIIPSSSERMAVDGVADLITHLQKAIWPKFGLEHQEVRILFTMYRANTTHSPAIVESARRVWRDNVLPMQVPHSTAFARSYDEKKPLPFAEPQHPGSIAYGALADWLITYEKNQA
jgi:chromosome partitioning protein